MFPMLTAAGTPAMANAASQAVGASAGLDMASMAPILQGLMGSLGQDEPINIPASLGTSVQRGGNISPVALPQLNPASIRNRL